MSQESESLQNVQASVARKFPDADVTLSDTSISVTAADGSTFIRIESDDSVAALAQQFEKAFEEIKGLITGAGLGGGQGITEIVAKVGVRRPPPPPPPPGSTLGDPGDGEGPGQGPDQGIEQGPDDGADGPDDPDQQEPDGGTERPRPKVG